MIEAKPKIFISHSVSASESEWIAEFARTLRSLGLETSFADSVENYRLRDTSLDMLERGLRGSDIVVLILPKQASSNPSIFFEFGAAVGMGKRILVVVSPDMNVSEIPLSAIRAEKVLVHESPIAAAEAVAAVAQAA